MLTTPGFRKQRSSRPGKRSGGDTAEVIAAVDLGSNSFHMKVARVVLLRIAVVMHRGRQDVDLAGVHVEAGEGWLRLGFPEKWLSEHPLTEADLAREKAYLKAAGVELRIGGQN
jgi:exopolyphosphatase / guanosine-5'-triphosphate,3'-diphosphate pyrophosphatase